MKAEKQVVFEWALSWKSTYTDISLNYLMMALDILTMGLRVS